MKNISYIDMDKVADEIYDIACTTCPNLRCELGDFVCSEGYGIPDTSCPDQRDLIWELVTLDAKIAHAINTML